MKRSPKDLRSQRLSRNLIAASVFVVAATVAFVSIPAAASATFSALETIIDEVIPDEPRIDPETAQRLSYYEGTLDERMRAAQLASRKKPGTTVDSTDPLALRPPAEWSCDLEQLQEYRRFLDSGAKPETWTYALYTYRDVSTGKDYELKDFIAWANQNGCGKALAVPQFAPGMGPLGPLLVPALPIFGETVKGNSRAISGPGGIGPDSPG